jgi:hypothetical protein
VCAVCVAAGLVSDKQRPQAASTPPATTPLTTAAADRSPTPAKTISASPSPKMVAMPNVVRKNAAVAMDELQLSESLGPVRRRASIPTWSHAEPSACPTKLRADRRTRTVAPPEGLLTLGFDPTRFQTEPPACYRASWQLSGPDSHRQATTSLRLKVHYTSPPPSLLGARKVEANPFLTYREAPNVTGHRRPNRETPSLLPIMNRRRPH